MPTWIAILIVDFGLVVLVWMTQLISYPGFEWMEGEKLLEWHVSYTSRITVIVMPLMFAQVGLKGWELTQDNSALAYISAVLVAFIWLSTFFQAVPLHNQIGSGQATPAVLSSLVRVNWIRTILWTLVFSLDIYRYADLLKTSTRQAIG